MCARHAHVVRTWELCEKQYTLRVFVIAVGRVLRDASSSHASLLARAPNATSAGRASMRSRARRTPRDLVLLRMMR